MPRVALGLFAAALIAAIVAGKTGASFMTGFEQPQPALAAVAPEVSARPSSTSRPARRVVLVIVDGLALESSRGLPYLDSLRARGVDAMATSHYPSWSRPNYVSILTGVPPTASGIRTNHHPWSIPLDTLMDRVQAARLHVSVVSDRAMIPPLFVRPMGTDLDDLEIRFSGDHTSLPAGYTWPFDDARYSREEIGRVATDLVAGSAELVIVLTGVVDAAGHASGRDSDAYRQAARDADAMLAHALARLDLSRDAVIVTADHGHSASGGHGGVEPDVLNVPLIAAGAGIAAGHHVDGARLIDISPTIAALLGVSAPGHALGRTLTEILRDHDATNLDDRDWDRAVHMQAVIDAAVDADADVVARHRMYRGLAVIAGAILAIAFGVRARRRGWIAVDRRIAIGIVPIVASFGVSLLVVAGSLSPSLIPTRGDIVTRAVAFAIAMVAIQLGVTGWLLRGRAGRLADACGLAWVALVTAAIVGGAAWAAFPPPYTTMPGPVWLVAIPTLELAAACGAAAVAVMLGLELALSRRRSLRR